MNMLDWARQEVEIACRKENPDKKRGGSLIMGVLVTRAP